MQFEELVEKLVATSARSEVFRRAFIRVIAAQMFEQYLYCRLPLAYLILQEN